MQGLLLILQEALITTIWMSSSPKPLFRASALCRLPLWRFASIHPLSPNFCASMGIPLSFVLHFCGEQFPSTTPVSGLHLCHSHNSFPLYPEATVSVPHLGDHRSTPLLWSDSGEEKMLMQAALREHDYLSWRVLRVLATSPGDLQSPYVLLSL